MPEGVASTHGFLRIRARSSSLESACNVVDGTTLISRLRQNTTLSRTRHAIARRTSSFLMSNQAEVPIVRDAAAERLAIGPAGSMRFQ